MTSSTPTDILLEFGHDLGVKRVESRNDVGFINRVLVIIFHLAGGGINDERAMGLGMLD